MKKIIIFILVAAAVLISIWFKDGYILGTAEDGLIFYSISNYFHQAEYTWMEYPGLGSPSLSLIAAKPTYLLLSLEHSRVAFLISYASICCRVRQNFLLIFMLTALH